ncbi:MAG: radical SAM protein [Bdellovibrionales bacterium]|nr:radical SAM protein [Bdellovibrionales bacterium]
MKAFRELPAIRSIIKRFGRLGSSEPVFVDVCDRAEFETNLPTLQALSEMTNKLQVALPLEDFASESPVYLDSLNCGWILSAKFEPSSRTSQVFEGFGLDRYVDNTICEKFDRVRHLGPGLPIVPEIRFSTDNIQHLSSTIQRVLSFGFDELHLRPTDAFSEQTVRSIRQLYIDLQINVDLKKNRVCISPLLGNSRAWSMNTLSSQGYLRHVHIDLSNKCTHSCNFCGLYANEAMRLNRDKNGKLKKNVVEVMRQEADGSKLLKFIDDLPWSVEYIQFGGVGDPLLHPMAVELIVAARDKGCHVEVLSNLEYLSDEQVSEICEVANYRVPNVEIIVNISGPDEKTYLTTRPRQNSKHFAKVMRNLQRFAEFKKRNGFGADLTLMQVITNENYRSVVDMAKLAVELGAKILYFKTLEIHSPFMKKQALTASQRAECVELLDYARVLAKAGGVFIKDEKHLFPELDEELLPPGPDILPPSHSEGLQV